MPQKKAKSRLANAKVKPGRSKFYAINVDDSSSDDFYIETEDDSTYESEVQICQDALEVLRTQATRTEAYDSNKRKFRTIYTGNSRTTLWRRKKKQKAMEESIEDCLLLNLYFAQKGPVTLREHEVPEWEEELNDLFAGIQEEFDDPNGFLQDDFDPDEFCDELGEEAEFPAHLEDDIEIHQHGDTSESEDSDVDNTTNPPESEYEEGIESDGELRDAKEIEANEAQEHLTVTTQSPFSNNQMEETITILLDDTEDTESDVVKIVEKNLKDLWKLHATGAVLQSLLHLSSVAEYVKLRQILEKHPKCKTPWLTASLQVAACRGKGFNFARTIHYNTNYLKEHKKLPPYERGKNGQHTSWLDNEAVLQKVKVYLASLKISDVRPRNLRKHIVEKILPELSAGDVPNDLSSKISLSTVHRWMHKLGYTLHSSKKGIYVDGHERPDVLQSRQKFLADIAKYSNLMCSYDEKTMEPLPLNLQPGECKHILVVQDESIFHINDQQRELWLAGGQQVLRKKGNGRVIHISDFLCEKSDTRRLSLSTEQLALHETLPREKQLKGTDSRKIIYPGKNADWWWDMPQLLEQTKDAVDIFEYLHQGATGIFLFDCLSAHEAYAADALNVNNMNVNPGGKQTILRDTIIPMNNPPPRPGRPDTRGQPQSMMFPEDFPDPELAGKAKGLLHVLAKCESVWEEFLEALNGKKPVGVCKICKLSQKKKDALARIERAEKAGQEDNAEITNEIYESAEQNVPENVQNWCCAKCVLSLQQDFVDKKPMLQTYLETHGHVCLFLPKFHCELNAIELYWGFAKYKYRESNDGKFATAKQLVPHCLDLCETTTIRRFFHKCWRYMDSYQKGLDFLQAAKAVKKYKSHQRIPEKESLIS